MLIPDQILATLQTMKTNGKINTIIYDSANSANVRIDDSADPIAILYLISDWNVDVRHGIAKEIANIRIFFGKRAEFDIKGEDKDIIVDDMLLIGKYFINEINNNSVIRIIDDRIKIRNVWGKFDSFLCGVEIIVQVEQKQGECILNEDNEENEG